jgi:DNA-binding CsgD family transcriptional regulator
MSQHPHQQALAGVIGAIGSRSFDADALAQLNDGVLQAASWSVYQVWRDRPPVLHLSASRGVADTTRDCFAAYRDGLYRRDCSFDRVRAVRPGHAAVLLMRADDAPNADHREIIYRRHRVLERLSVAALQDDGSLLALNLYHHAHQGSFDAGERANLEGIAPLLLAAVRRHLALAADPPGSPGDTRAALAQRCTALTPRELDVCERLLRGWSHDGIAADLGLSVATVKTYRARAFDRLGLHFRSELFALFGRNA